MPGQREGTIALVTGASSGIGEATAIALASERASVANEVADAVVYIVTRPRHMAVNELLVRPSEQAD